MSGHTVIGYIHKTAYHKIVFPTDSKNQKRKMKNVIWKLKWNDWISTGKCITHYMLQYMNLSHPPSRICIFRINIYLLLKTCSVVQDTLQDTIFSPYFIYLVHICKQPKPLPTVGMHLLFHANMWIVWAKILLRVLCNVLANRYYFMAFTYDRVRRMFFFFTSSVVHV